MSEKWVEIDDTINFIAEYVELRNCSAKYIVNKLNSQDQQIQELQEQLKKAIVPKFKIDDKVWIIAEKAEKINTCECCGRSEVVYIKKPIQVKVQYFCWYGKNGLQYTMFDDNTKTQYCYYDCYEVFATKEEAEQKLKEIQGENQ